LLVFACLLDGSASWAQTGVPDGIWRFRQNYCIRYTQLDLTTGQAFNDRRCAKNVVEQFMFASGVAYYGGASGDRWIQVGTVSETNRRIEFLLTRDGVSNLIRGVFLGPLVNDFTFSFAGKHRGKRIVKGKVDANLTTQDDDQLFSIVGGGRFVGKRIGDTCCLDASNVTSTQGRGAR
jgi:hypothetical protein